MPMILQASYAMLACARIGAIHSVVFGGFSFLTNFGVIAFPNNRCLICTLWQMPVNTIVSHIQLTQRKVK
jgi:acyl-coenzyme A synthetase/AMP-(fatty) acid ligase